jgi:invasion protein IalB
MIFKSNFTKKAALSAFAGAVAVAAMPAASFAQEQAAGRPPQGWFKVCTKQEDNDVCIVQNLLSARLIPPGIQMQIDGGKGVKLDYAICMPDKCIAEVPLSDGVLANLKKGGEVVFTSVNFQRAPNPIKISLNGFTGVFDGEPIEQSKLQERQRLLQEEMQKKAEDARKKLEEAQKAAKQN